MKFYAHLFTLLFITVVNFNYFAQCTFVSTNGYTVKVSIAPVNLIQHTNGGGCTYETVMQYNVTFTGMNIPSHLYTLQGTVFCYGSSQFFNLPNNGGSGFATSATTNGPFIAGACSEYKPIGCTSVNITIEGPGIPAQTVPCSFAVFPNPLPTELISFTGEKVSKGVEFNWSTASERNNDHFTIESSTNGLDFTPITSVKGAGTTNEVQHYFFFEPSYTSGLIYYRLSQTDFDGTTKRMDIIVINKELENSFLVYPNPTNDGTINVQSKSQQSTIDYSVYSLLGQVLSTGTIHFDNAVEKIALPEGGTSFYLEFKQDDQVIDRQLIQKN